jgi:lambda repressor-like predicted transcriptional regulator
MVAYGRSGSPYVDNTEAADRVRDLRAQGWTVRGISKASGVTTRSLEQLLAGNFLRIRNDSATAILAIAVGPPPTGKWDRVPTVGARRRLQALMFMGWSFAELERQTGMGRKYLSLILRQEFIEEATHKKVAAIYDELWNTHPPLESPDQRTAALRARNHSRARGWHGPLHWDDPDNDAEPTDVEIDTSELRGTRVLENAEWLLNAGETPEIIVGTLNRTAGSLAKLARHHDRPDIATRFYALDRYERPAA